MSTRRCVVASARRVPALALAAGAVLSLGVAAQSASAQFVWIGPASGSGTMNTAANWAGGVAPPASNITTTLTFTGNGTPPPSVSGVGTATNDISNPLDVDSLFFSLAYSGGFTLNGSTATHAFRLNGAGAIQQNGQGNVTFSSSGGLLNLATNASISGSGLGNLTFGGVISESGGSRSISISGAGATHNSRVVVLNATNTFSGGVSINNGAHLQLGNAAALGTGLSALTVGSGGGILSTSGGITPTAAAGSTITLDGQLRYVGTGTLTLGSNLALTGAGNLLLNSIGSGSSLIVQSNSSGYTGTVTFDVGALPNISGTLGLITLSGNNGAMANVPTWNLRAGSGLVLSSNVSATTPNANRIGDSAAVNLRNGLLTLTGAVGGTALTETMGALSGAGYSTVTATPGTTAGATTLAASSLAREDRGTFLFRGTNLGTVGNNGAITFATAPTGDLVGGGGSIATNVSILPYAIGDITGTGVGSSFVTYGATGVRPLATGEYVSNLTSAADSNVGLTASTANAGSVTLNALRLTSSGAVTGAGTLNVTSGAILNTNSTATIANTVNFGSAEGHVFTPASLTISGPLTGSNGLTKSGASNLILSGNNSGLTGQLTINNGFVAFAAGNNLPGTGQIIANGTSGGTTSVAGLLYTGASPLTVARDINVGSGWFNLRSSGSSAPITYSGVISGSGGLYIDTTSDIVLAGANTYTGNTRVNNGNVRISSDANLGNGGGFDFGNGSAMGIILDGDWTTSRHINASLTSGTLTFNTQGFNATLNGPLTNFGSNNLASSNDALRKAGTGTLRINAPGTMGSYTIVVNSSGGEVRLANDGALLSPTYTINSSGRLVLDNATVQAGTGPGAQTVSRVSDNATVNLVSGGTLNLIGNASQSLTEIIGAVTATGSGNVLQVNSSGSQLTTLRIGNLSASGGSLLVRGDNLGGTLGSIGRIVLNQFNGATVNAGQILTNVTGEDLANPGVIEQAVYDGPVIGIRLLNPVLDFTNGVAIQNAAPTSLPTTANFRVNPSVANPVPVLDAANTINALRFAPLGVVDYTAAGNSVLTITTGSLLSEAGGAAAITVGGPGTLTLTSGVTNLAAVINSDLTSAAAIGGSGGLTKSGLGTLTLTGGASNTGTLTVNGGTLAMNSAGSFGLLSVGAAGTLSIGGTLSAGGSSGSSIAGTLSGAGALTYAPPSAQTLTVASTANTAGYSGNTGVGPNGRLQINSAGGLGTGTVTLGNTTTQTMATFGAGNVTVPTNFTLSSASAVTTSFSNGSVLGQTTTLGGKISGGAATSTFRVSGPADDSSTFVLTNATNDFLGTVSVFEGVLAITSDAALGNADNDLSLNSTSTTRGGLRFDAPGIVLNASRTVTFVDSNVIDTQAFSAGIDGVIAGTGTTNVFTKAGAGTLTITNNANTIVSNVAVSAGTLLVNGNLPGNSTANSLTVAVGATLGGDGTVGTSLTSTRNVTVNGTLSPGNSAGDLQIFGNLSFSSASAFMVELNGPAIGTGYDSVTYSGSLSLSTIGAGVALSTSLGYTPTLGDIYWIAVDSTAGSVTGTFAGLLEGDTVTLGTFAGNTWTAQISYAGNFEAGLVDGSGNDIVLYNVIPAPGAVGLLSMAGLLAARRRRR